MILRNIEFKSIKYYKNMMFDDLTNLYKNAASEYWKKWYEKNKDKFKELVKQKTKLRRDEIRNIIIEYKNKPCSKCGKNYHHSALMFVHIDPSNKNFNISKAISKIFSKEKLVEEILKCFLICNNCYRIMLNENIDKKRSRIKEFFDMFKTVPCKDCGEIYPFFVMEFDHLGNKSSNVSRMINDSKPFEDILNEVGKTEPICANCHKVRTYTRRIKE